MNTGIGRRHPNVLLVSILIFFAAALSGCLTETKTDKVTLDQQIASKQIQGTQKEVIPGKNETPDTLVGEVREIENELEPIGPDVLIPDASWEHINKAGILGLQTPVKKFKPAPETTANMHIDLAFDNASLTEVLDLILYEHFGIKYMVDPSINSKLTFHIDGEFSNQTIIAKLNSILHLNGIAIVEGIGSIYKVVLKNDSARSGAFTLNDTKGLQQTGDVTRQIKVKYLNAVDTAKTLRSFISKNALIVPNVLTNSLLVTDTPENILKVASIIDVLDTPFFTDISWKVFPVYEAKAETIAVDLEKVFKSKGLFSRPGMTNGSYQIIPIKTINGILVLTKWPEIFKTMETWIKIMDQVDEDTSDVFVYYVENGYAEDLANILKEVYGGKVSSAGDSGSQKIVQATVGQPTVNKPKKVATRKTISGELTDDVKIIADEINNAIIFKANPGDFATIRKILKKLDITPRQVLLNVVVAEVTLTKAMDLGVQWLITNNNIGGYDTMIKSDKNDSFITTATGLGSSTGFTFGAFDSADALRALVTAVGTDSDINILSSPNIIGVDNKEAIIEVTEETPTVTGSVTDSNGGVTNTVQFKKTGIILTATPSINSRGLVKLDLSQEVSERGAYDEETDNYIFNTRKAVTSLVVENKQTIFIGGMMRERTSVEDQGIPFLKDIPGLGYLFKSEQQRTDKIELIFLITPHVIRSRSEADLITKEFTEKIGKVKELIDK